jgi:hypothetical protein
MAIANTTIQIKKSVVSGNTPSSLANGEIAINSADGKLFYRTPSGSIASISQALSFATVNANSSLILATTSTDTLSFAAANGISIVANTTSKVITIGDAATQNLANSKTQTYYQNNSPSAPNPNDFWLANTGVLYENFGNTTNPVWAEVGPTGTLINTAPGIVSATSLNVSYFPTSTIGSAIQVTAANTIGGTGYGDFIRATNGSGNATNPNKTFRLNSTGGFEIINSAYTATLLTLDDSGNLALAGNVTMAGAQAGYSVNRPAFRVYGANTTNALTTTQNGTGQLNYNNWALDYNQGGYLNYTGGTFTAPFAGLYQINLVCRNAGNASSSQLICYKNGSTVMTMIEFAGSSTMNHTGSSTVAKLAAGDTLVIKVVLGTITFDGNDNWSVAYLG